MRHSHHSRELSPLLKLALSQPVSLRSVSPARLRAEGSHRRMVGAPGSPPWLPPSSLPCSNLRWAGAREWPSLRQPRQLPCPLLLAPRPEDIGLSSDSPLLTTKSSTLPRHLARFLHQSRDGWGKQAIRSQPRYILDGSHLAHHPVYKPA